MKLLVPAMAVALIAAPAFAQNAVDAVTKAATDAAVGAATQATTDAINAAAGTASGKADAAEEKAEKKAKKVKAEKEKGVPNWGNSQDHRQDGERSKKKKKD